MRLAPPAGWTVAQRDQFRAWVRESSDDSDGLVNAPTSLRAASTKAAYSVVADLINQGWDLSCEPTEVLVRAPIVNGDPEAERERVRKQELLKRDEHLRRSSVRQFIERMETQRRHGDQQVSVFSLMRDGHDLAASLREVSGRESEQGSGLRSAIDPYLQVVASSERCQHTGLRLTDIWRYFRLTWTNQYTSTPGRTLMILVRDRAAPFHPVIGIAALGSPIVQLKEREDWIGWQRDGFLDEAQERPARRLATWVWRRLDQQLDELYLADPARPVVGRSPLSTPPSHGSTPRRADPSNAR